MVTANEQVTPETSQADPSKPSSECGSFKLGLLQMVYWATAVLLCSGIAGVCGWLYLIYVDPIVDQNPWLIVVSIPAFANLGVLVYILWDQSHTNRALRNETSATKLAAANPILSGLIVRLLEFGSRYDIFLVSLLGLWLLTFAVFPPTLEVQLLLRTLGVAVLASGVGGFLTRSRTTLGFFRQAVADIVFGNEHLSTRGDIKHVWIRVSKAIIDRKFPAIADGILGEMEALYLDRPLPYYRDKYTYSETVEWADAACTRLKITSLTTTSLVPKDKSSTITIFTEITLPKSAALLGVDMITELKIDGKCYLNEVNDPANILAADWVPDSPFEVFKRDFSGNAVYHFRRGRIREFDPAVDPCAFYNGSHPIKNLRVDIINRAPGLNIRFIPIGTGRPWVNGRDPRVEYLSAVTCGSHDLTLTYNSVTLPNQGFAVEYTRDVPNLTSGTPIPTI